MKEWYKSKTVWFNIISLVVGIMSLISQSPILENKTEILYVLATVQSIGNVILRFITVEPIK